MITLANTAATASSTESTVQNSVSGTTTTTTTKDLTVLVESVYLYGKGVEVLEGNFQQVGALGPGQSLKPPSSSGRPPMRACTSPRYGSDSRRHERAVPHPGQCQLAVGSRSRRS